MKFGTIIKIAATIGAITYGYMIKLALDEGIRMGQIMKAKLNLDLGDTANTATIMTRSGREVIVRSNFAHAGQPMFGFATMASRLGFVIGDGDLVNLKADTVPVIFTDTEYEGLSEGTKAFIMLHEMGHIDNGDLERAVVSNGLEHRDYDEETAADLYAAKYLGRKDVLKAMDELIRYYTRPAITIKFAGITLSAVNELKRRRAAVADYFAAAK